MPQVPYNPVPSVTPEAPGERIAIDTPGAAFGENIAQQVQRLGATGEQVGGEIFNRAVALQQVNNEVDARDADTQFMMEVGQKYADFDSLEGKKRSDAYPQFIKDLGDSRQKYRGSLSNSAAQRLFDASSLQTMGWAVRYGARAAAQGLREGNITSAKANGELIDTKALSDPGNDKLFRDSIANKLDLAHQIAASHDFDPGSPEWKREELEQVSNLYSSRISGLSKEGKTDAADALFEEGRKLGRLTPQAQKMLEGSIVHQKEAIQSDNIAQSVVNENPDMNQEQAANKAYADTMDATGGDARAAHMARNNAKTFWTERERAITYQRNKIHDDLVPIIAQYQPKTVQELMAAPGGSQLINSLDDKGKRLIDGWLADYYQKRNSLNHAANLDTFEKLKGESVADTAKFMDRNPLFPEVGADERARTELQTIRKRITDGQNANPQVWRANSWIRGAKGETLKALEIDHLDKNNPEPYYRYTGALSQALEAFQEQTGKPATWQDVMKEGGIADQVLNTHMVGGINIPLIGPSFQHQEGQPGAFNVQIPPEVIQGIRQEEVDKGNAEPTDAQIYQRYFQQYYTKFFKGSSGRSNK